MQGQLLEAWAKWADDPAAHVATWLATGAPAGVAVDFKLDGILEPVDAERPTPPDELVSDEASFMNYSGLEDDPQAMEIIEGSIAKGWLREFNTYEELAAFV